jgi:hypothetical protein
MLGLRYFTILCNDVEYKSMDQDESSGQLYDVQIRIKIFYKQSGWAYSFSTTLSWNGWPAFNIPLYKASSSAKNNEVL